MKFGMVVLALLIVVTIASGIAVVYARQMHRTMFIELNGLQGKQAKLVLVDDSSKGHLNIDDVWLWP